MLKKDKQIRRAKRAGNFLSTFIGNAKEIQTNPAREARRGDFLIPEFGANLFLQGFQIRMQKDSESKKDF